MARTHMASDESLQQIFAAVSGTTMAAAGDGRTAVLATGNEDTIGTGNERAVRRLVDGELESEHQHL